MSFKRGNDGFDNDDEKLPLLPRNDESHRFAAPPTQSALSMSPPPNPHQLSTASQLSVGGIIQTQPTMEPMRSTFISADYDVSRIPINIDLNAYYHPKVFSFTKCIVIPFFILVICIVIMLYCLWSVGVITELQSICLICAFTIIVSWMSAFGVFYFGTIQATIDDFKDQNGKYKDNINDLSETKNELKTHTKGIHFSVQKLKRSAHILDKQLEKFEGLISSLQSIASDNEELNEMVNGYLNAIDDMESIITRHEEAELLIMFYETIRDGKNKMLRHEFEKLLSKMNVRNRNAVKAMGGFEYLDKNNDGVVDVMEFQNLINSLIDQKNENLSLIKKRTNMIRKKSNMLT